MDVWISSRSPHKRSLLVGGRGRAKRVRGVISVWAGCSGGGLISPAALQESRRVLEFLIGDDCVEGVVPERGGDPETWREK